MSSSARALTVLAVGALVLGFIAAGPTQTVAVGGDGSISADDGTPGEGVGPTGTDGPILANGDTPGRVDDPSRADATGKRTAGRQGLECAPGKNGGATDVGVTGTKIRLASTVVIDGPAASLLSGSPKAIQAVINKVNRSGGICGRQLEFNAVNDGFDAARGQSFLRSFIDAKYFALPVVPSAEGLSTTIEGGYITQAGIPVVGTDGMRIEQYQNDWVWPVATATASTMRIMAKYGVERHKAKTFALVYDSKYQFGLEGKEAFEQQVKAMGGTLVTSTGLDPTRTSYSSEVAEFNRACSNGCDMVAMLLLPDAARTWMSARPKRATLFTSAAQTLFSDGFAQACAQVAAENCNGITVWTGYNPPIGALATTPGASTYINDVTSVDPRIDVKNQFVEGAYLGMSVFVEALRRVGPDLTRQRLREELDRMTFESDLAPPLTWRPKKHHANGKARAFSMVVGSGTFTGWRDEQTGFVQDPTLGS